MHALLTPVLKAMGKAFIGMLMSLATEEFFKEVLIMIAEIASKSTKTEFDDKLVAKIKEALGKEDEA